MSTAISAIGFITTQGQSCPKSRKKMISVVTAWEFAACSLANMLSEGGKACKEFELRFASMDRMYV